MFRSFFPMPKIFFPSAIIWIILSTIIWFWIGADIAKIVGFNIDEDAEPKPTFTSALGFRSINQGSGGVGVHRGGKDQDQVPGSPAPVEKSAAEQ